MNINSIFQFFLPRGNKFFDLFDLAAENVLQGAELLNRILNSRHPAERQKLINELEKTEHRGDELTHEIIRALNQSFITPFDREDIHSLATTLDDFLDFINASARSLEIYKIPEVTHEIQKLGELCQQSALELTAITPKLRSLRNMTSIRQSIVRINSIENEADSVFEYALSEMFSTQTDAIHILKIKEVLALLEMATDKAEDAAHTIESIMLKAS